jgi:hypothetical protein
MNTYCHISTVFGLRQEGTRIYLVTRQRSFLHQHKEVIADPAGLLSLNLRGRSFGIVSAWMSGAGGIDECTMA